MVKRTSLEVKKAILQVLSDNEVHSYVDLEREVNTNWLSIRNHILELDIFEAVFVKDNKVRITDKGKEFLNKMKKI